ncbi:hypothetical protein [Streptomyces sp. AC555_RSS877]|uniref:hypothetical protein n=1 Tax=Streptomyces sp. AC555_RSS877 TaxID=2823688 RepID=UPI001C2520DD
MTWTDREVKAFTQVGVEPGERVEVMIVVLAGDCTVVARDAASSERMSSNLLLGSSSRIVDLLSTAFTVDHLHRASATASGPGSAVMPGACDRFTVSARDGTLHGLFARPGTETELRAAGSPGRRTPPTTGAGPRTPVRRTGAG